MRDSTASVGSASRPGRYVRAIQPRPHIRQGKKTDWKAVGGGDRDQWNERLLGQVARTLPFKPENTEAISRAGSAVMAGVVDTKPTDPIEGMLIAQLVVANEAALDLYRRACPNRHFEAHTKYLQLGDKASRTVALLTERLDQRRGRGQQQITVKHVTVNADQQWSPIKLLAAEPRRVLPPC